MWHSVRCRTGERPAFLLLKIIFEVSCNSSAVFSLRKLYPKENNSLRPEHKGNEPCLSHETLFWPLSLLLDLSLFLLNLPTPAKVAVASLAVFPADTVVSHEATLHTATASQSFAAITSRPRLFVRFNLFLRRSFETFQLSHKSFNSSH